MNDQLLERKEYEAYESFPVRMLNLEDLEPDPLNQEAFSMEDIDSLAASMEESGFFGIIAAYPLSNGHFRIESGHRRYEAAYQAGIHEIPVHITTEPEDEIERRMRLTKWNLHSRSTTPLNMARLAQFLHETYEMENARRSSIGLKPLPINEQIASDMECSISNVVKYKSLLKLIPNLQELVDSGDYSWAILSQASNLPENQQRTLYDRIIGASRLRGPESVTGTWIQNEINDYKHFKNESTSTYRFDPNELKPYQSSMNDLFSFPDSHIRRKDGAKKIKKAATLLNEAFDSDSLIKKEKRAEAIKDLQNMKKLIEDQIFYLQHLKK